MEPRAVAARAAGEKVWARAEAAWDAAPALAQLRARAVATGAAPAARAAQAAQAARLRAAATFASLRPAAAAAAMGALRALATAHAEAAARAQTSAASSALERLGGVIGGGGGSGAGAVVGLLGAARAVDWLVACALVWACAAVLAPFLWGLGRCGARALGCGVRLVAFLGVRLPWALLLLPFRLAVGVEKAPRAASVALPLAALLWL